MGSTELENLVKSGQLKDPLINSDKSLRESVSPCCKAQPAGNSEPSARGATRQQGLTGPALRGLATSPLPALRSLKCAVGTLTGCRHAGETAPCQWRRLKARDLSELIRGSLVYYRRINENSPAMAACVAL